MRKILLLAQAIIGVLFTLFAFGHLIRCIIVSNVPYVFVVAFAILLTLGIGLVYESIEENKK